MKATGVVRRIDDLGRVVIPKEIRRTLKINEGDSLEIFVDDNKIILNKYSVLDNMVELSKKIVDVFNKTYKKNIIITNNEKVIATSKQLEKDYLNKNLSNYIKNNIEKRKELIGINSNVVVDGNKEKEYFLVPIIANSDLIGSIIIVGEVDDNIKDVIRLIGAILVKNIEQ